MIKVMVYFPDAIRASFFIRADRLAHCSEQHCSLFPLGRFNRFRAFDGFSENRLPQISQTNQTRGFRSPITAPPAQRAIQSPAYP
jgi:hypothetical protein